MFSQLHCGQRIGRLPRLGDGNDDVILVNDWLSIAKFRGVFHLYRYAGIFFNGIHPYLCSVPGGAACSDDDAPGIEKLIPVVDKTGQGDVVRFHIYPAPHTITQCGRLLEYFLEHEMGISALLKLTECQFELLYLGRLLDIANCSYFEWFVSFDGDNLFITYIDHLIGVFNERGCIGTDKVFIFANADHQGTPFSGRDDEVGFVSLEYGNGISSHNLRESQLYSRGQIHVVCDFHIFDELHQYLRIGLALESVSFFYQPIF